jgi:2-polyprenyl-3-methyl-5-hydroxy-6-metoxy-1,4-benzoquinol methylase
MNVMSERFHQQLSIMDCIPVACTLCQKQNHALLFRPRLSPGPVVKCQTCGLVYVSPVKHTERLAETIRCQSMNRLFDVAENPAYRRLYLAEAPIKKLLYEEMLNRIESAMDSKGALLDVGSYMGLFMQAAADRGWVCKGIEPDRQAWEYAVHTLGLDVHCGTTDTASLSAGSFDVITMLQVLEHLTDPYKELIRLSEILRPGGVLYVEVPNIDCWPVKMLGRYHRHFAMHHFTFFGPYTLKKLLGNCGFEIIDISYPKRYISSRLLSMALESWHPLIYRIVRHLLASKPLCDCVLGVNLHEVISVSARKASSKSIGANGIGES